MALGFLMTGGASSRMRRPKALLPWYPSPSQSLPAVTTLAAHLCGVLRDLCQQTYVVGDLDIPAATTVRLCDAIPGIGPLGGVLSALRLPGDDWRVLLSCDTPFVTVDFLRELLAYANQSDGVDAVVARSPDGQLHPLCGVYHSRAVSTLEEILAQHALVGTPVRGTVQPPRAPSMHRFLRALPHQPLEPADPSMLRNLNTMQDYLAALLGASSPI